MEKSARAQLVDAVRVCLGEQLERGRADREVVTECVMARFPDLCAAAASAMMREAIGAWARKMMGRGWTPDDERQLRLPDLPLPIRHLKLPSAITVPVADSDDERVEWVALRFATLADLEAHLAMLRRQIEADIASADAQQVLLNFVRPIMRRHPEMTLAEALQRAERDAA